MDWNGDGVLDILSGCYWSDEAQAGHIQILAGRDDGEFEEAAPVMTVADVPLINAVSENEPEEEGEETSPGDDVEWRNICTHQHAVDYDGDGDLDLVVGCIGSEFFYVENVGEARQPALVEKPQQLSVAVPGGHSSPHLVDWDDDGDLDLLSGSANGGAYFSENVGSRSTPEWSDFKPLIPPATGTQQTTDGGQEIVPARSSRIWLVDWNRDGLLDILLGDSVTITNCKEGISDEELTKLKSGYDERVSEALEEYSKASEEYNAAQASGEVPDEVQTRYETVTNAYREVYESKKEFLDEQITGFVWLYLQRKPGSP